MSDYRYDPEQLEVGDTFEGGPIEMGYFLSAILGVGGKLTISGDTATITYLPPKSEAKAEVPAEVEAIVAATIEAIEAAEPKAETIKETQASIDQIEKFNEEVKDATPEANEAVAVNVSGEFEEVLHTKDQDEPAPKPAPKPRGRKPKAAPAPAPVEEQE